MRSPPDDFATFYTPFSAGPPAPFATVQCRSVRALQIRPVVGLMNDIWGYITTDPPDLFTAGVTSNLIPNAMAYDFLASTPVELASQLGVLYFIWSVENVTTASDSYRRLWLIPVTSLP